MQIVKDRAATVANANTGKVHFFICTNDPAIAFCTGMQSAYCNTG
jgi:hypothetical protein